MGNRHAHTGDVLSAVAHAHPVQGLVCAHGFQDPKLHLAFVPNVFVSIGALSVDAHFSLSRDSKGEARFLCQGRAAPVAWRNRGIEFVRKLLRSFDIDGRFDVDIKQNFSSNSGLGSSAAVYAALTIAVVRALRAHGTSANLSALARLGSYSGAAAITGNVSVIRSSTAHKRSVAEVICDRRNFPFDLLVLPVKGDKRSEEIHEDVLRSTYFDAWLRIARRVSRSVIQNIRSGQFENLGAIVEPYLYENFGVITTGPRKILSWRPGTLRRLESLRRIRDDSGVPFFIAMNSGPAVFAYVAPDVSAKLEAMIRNAGFACVLSKVGDGAMAATAASD